MNSLNKVQLIGNLTRDPECKATPGGQSVATISIATNRAKKNENGQWESVPDFHVVVLWEKLADMASKYLKKGNRVYFGGKLQTRSWENSEGQRHYRTEVVANEMILLSPKTEEKEEKSEFVSQVEEIFKSEIEPEKKYLLSE